MTRHWIYCCCSQMHNPWKEQSNPFRAINAQACLFRHKSYMSLNQCHDKRSPLQNLRVAHTPETNNIFVHRSVRLGPCVHSIQTSGKNLQSQRKTRMNWMAECLDELNNYKSVLQCLGSCAMTNNVCNGCRL